MWPASLRVRWPWRSLGLRISKSEVSRICQGLDEQVDAFRNRPLEGRYPYLWLDAKVEKVRDSGRVVRKCLVLAYAVHRFGLPRSDRLGRRRGPSARALWRSFLRSLVERGLTGVELVVSDAHAGLRKAIAQVLGCPWQRCSVHFLREALGRARRGATADAGGAPASALRRRGRQPCAGALGRGARAATQAAAQGRGAPGRTRRTCSPSSTASPPTTGPSCPPRTRSSESIARSAAALTSSASFQTTARSSAWPPRSSSNRTTNGSSTALSQRSLPGRGPRSREKDAEREARGSPRPEQPTMPASYTTYRDLTYGVQAQMLGAV